MRRNPARMWTILAVLAALLMVGALAALYLAGPQQISAWMGAEADTASAALHPPRRHPRAASD
jgi:hypothetical protein